MLTISRLKLVSVPFFCLFVSACGFEPAETGPERTDPLHVDLGDVERANVELDMGAGEMNIRGGATKLMDGSIDYNVPAWKPLVKTSTNGTSATVTIKQPDDVHMAGHTRYAWDLSINNDVLLDLAINCGAGQARLKLGSLNLRGVSVHMGAGQVDLNLNGHPRRDYDVKIEGGIGQATIDLPSGVGIWVDAHGGIGSITVNGLQKRGDHWENDLYDKSPVTVKVSVKGGIGEISING